MLVVHNIQYPKLLLKLQLMVRHKPCTYTLTSSPLEPAMSLVQLNAQRVHAL
jgi:hypothetical protein